MNQKVKVVENEGFSIEAAEESGCRLNVKVFVKPKSAQKAYQKAVKLVNKRISIPGFRKGHAPDKTVISRHSAYVEQEWKELLVNEAYRAALELSEIYPMSRESVDKPKIESSSQEEGAIVRIAYEHYPQVPTIDFSKLKIPKIAKDPVDTAKVEEILEEVGRSHADWEDVQDRAVKQGDFVDVTIDAIDQEPPKNIVKDRRFEVTDKRLAPWLRKLLIGLKPGETIEGVSELDVDAEEQIKKNFKSTHVRITLHAIKKMLPPPLDDTLAQKASAASIEDLKEKIRSNLEQESEEQQKLKQIEALEQVLLSTYAFDLPASLVEAERSERIARKIKALKNENVPDDEIKAQESYIEKEAAHELDAALRLYFLNKQIIKQGQISLSNQELNEAIVHQMSQNPYLHRQDRDEQQMRDYISNVASAMMQRKLKEYALSQVGEK